MMLQSRIAILNDAKVWNNEVRVCSSNPSGLFLMVWLLRSVREVFLFELMSC